MPGTSETQNMAASQPRCSDFIAHYDVAVDHADLNV